ncbi:MAG: LytTR family DNA-binding domain-containing protein, partial [Turicibacter sp.]
INKLGYKQIQLKGIKDDKLYLIEADQVSVVFAENKKVYAKVKEDCYEIKYRLYELEATILDQTKFIRISNSAIINLSQVESFEASLNGLITIHFTNGDKEYISRRYLKKVKKFLNL